MKKFEEFIVNSGLNDKPHVLALDGYASHVTINVLKCTKD